MSKPRVILVFGAPCSGKTTFAEKFAQKFALTYLNLDQIIDEGFSREQLFKILEILIKTRQTFVIEGGINTESERSEIRNLFRRHNYEPSLIWIQTDIATIRTRLKSKFRSVSKAKKFFDNATSVMEAPTDFEKPIILSGKHTFETQTRHAITGLADLVGSK